MVQPLCITLHLTTYSDPCVKMHNEETRQHLVICLQSQESGSSMSHACQGRTFAGGWREASADSWEQASGRLLSDE